MHAFCVNKKKHIANTQLYSYKYIILTNKSHILGSLGVEPRGLHLHESVTCVHHLL